VLKKDRTNGNKREIKNHEGFIFTPYIWKCSLVLMDYLKHKMWEREFYHCGLLEIDDLLK